MDNAKTLTRITGTGSGPIDISHTVNGRQRLVSLSVTLSGGILVNENLVLKGTGDVETIFLVINPRDYHETTVDMMWYPPDRTVLPVGDVVNLAYANTASRTYTYAITFVEED